VLPVFLAFSPQPALGVLTRLFPLAIAVLSLLSYNEIGQATTPSSRTFLEWCQGKKNLSPAAKNTVEKILADIETQNCQAANDKLARTFALNLSNQNISDLTPLTSLNHLTQLNLYGNQIQDLTPLANLKNLNRLILGNNQISDLKPLSSLDKFKILVL
jgi:internalin A